MPHPIIIIELFDNNFEALYSNTDLKFIIVNRNGEEGEDDESDERKISGPYSPTLEKTDLTAVVEGMKIPESVLSSPAEGPYFCSPVQNEPPYYD